MRNYLRIFLLFLWLFPSDLSVVSSFDNSRLISVHKGKAVVA